MTVVLVEQLMTPSPTTIWEGTSLSDALDLMVKERFRHLPIVDEQGSLLGIVSDRDVKTALPDRTRPRSQFDEVARATMVEEIMSRDPLSVASQTPLVNAIAVMLSCRVGALPVVDDERLVGILTQTDILRRYAQDLSAPAQRPDSNVKHAPATIDIDVELSPPRVFVLSPDHRARSLLAAPLSDAGYMMQSFDSIPEMMTVWHLVLPDLLVLDRSTESNPNLHLLLKGGTPSLWLKRSGDRIFLTDDALVDLELPCPDELLQKAVSRTIGESKWTKDLPGMSINPKILVAEDDHVIRRILSHHLGRNGYELFEAHDGREATQLITNERFDLILLDINMPFFSGLDILRKLRASSDKTKRVILSASHRDETVMEAFQLGAHDFVKKPFNPEVLVRRLDRLLERA